MMSLNLFLTWQSHHRNPDLAAKVGFMRSRLSLCRCTRNGSSLVRSTLFVLITVTICSGCSDLSNADDHVSRLQAAAIADGKSALGHWGTDSGVYTKWRSHSNRLIPVYT
ncbi:MAG: hypothetical protein GY826_26465, partial [Fuerstiella sp.]|nr:hypothetical protein [Fuerstiella sp.]